MKTKLKNGPKMFLVQRASGEPSITVASQLRQSARRILRNKEKDPTLDLIELDPELVRLALRDYDERVRERMERVG